MSGSIWPDNGPGPLELLANPHIARSIQCSPADRRRLAGLVEKLADMARETRLSGMGELRRLREDGATYVLRSWVDMLFDDRAALLEDSQLVEMYGNYFVLSGIKGLELLENYISLLGILMIQNGCEAHDVRRQLSIALGLA